LLIKELKKMWKNRKLIKDLKNRSFPFGEGDGGWGCLMNRITKRTRVRRNGRG